MATMNFLKHITERGSVDQSLYPLLFGDRVQDMYYWYRVDGDLPRLARSVLRFYFGLIQAYCFAQAQARNKTLKELQLSDKLLSKVRKVWNADCEPVITSMNELFSYFSVATQCEIPEVFTPEAGRYVSLVARVTRELSGNSRAELTDPIPREDFLDFLDSLPLLRAAKFHKDTMKFELCLPREKLVIKASPFISFLSFDRNPLGEAVDAFTNDCYVLTAVSKGEANNELYFDTVRIDEQDDLQDKCRLSRNVRTNENLALLCKNANLETGFYSIDACWCDLKFLNSMVDATQCVLADYFDIGEIDQGQDVKDGLLFLLEESEKYTEVLKAQETIPFSQLNDLLFDLFLTEGLFKTVLYILQNRTDEQRKQATSRRMFRRYLDALMQMNVIRKSQISQIEAQCDEKIRIALEKLARIIPKNSPAFRRRESEIQAEWRTYFVLHAAGIQSDDLFADVESILSIDDYYDMIGNGATTLEYDLKRVLRSLCVFYGSLLELTPPMEEARFFEAARKVVCRYAMADHTVESLFDALISIAEKCENNPHMSELLGRQHLGLEAPKYLRIYKDKILGGKERSAQQWRTADSSSACDIFISYAHEDKDRVRPIVKGLREKGLRVFFDESDIHSGDDWRVIAGKAMSHESCKMVVAFCSSISVGKPAVAYEIKFARDVQKRKYADPLEQNRFLQIVNLETENVEDYLDRATMDLENTERRSSALSIQKRVSESVVFIGSADNAANCIYAAYEELVNSDGKVIPTQKLDASKLNIANLYAYFKTGDPQYKDAEALKKLFNDPGLDLSRCIFPILASVKESKIKRDNIAIVAYELIRGKGRDKTGSSQILTSRTLDITDYYCIPKYRNANEFKRWMVEPLLIRCDKFVEILSEGTSSNNESETNRKN